MATRKTIGGKPILYWVTLVAIIGGLALAATSGASSIANSEQPSYNTQLVPDPLPPGVPA
ncbi:MAG: hypothetical protein GWP62_03080 [Gammaproteobacteria bacterium]|jgi:hypothetical protein|nr:hypothetical protein [Gammaproteobacteria bacterium]